MKKIINEMEFVSHQRDVVNDFFYHFRLIHIVDWIPTLLSSVQDKLTKKTKKMAKEFLSEQRDGIDQWQTLMDGSPSPRTEFLYNIDPLYLQKGYPRGNAGIR